MLRWLKRIGLVILGLILLVVVSVSAVFAITSHRMARKYPVAVETVAIPSDSASVERGTHIAIAIGKCQECHGDNFGGKVLANKRIFMRLAGPNLTSGEGGVAGGYTDEDWVRSIRYGIGTDGRPLVFMPSDAFYGMTDSDLGAVIAYLKTLPPVTGAVPEKRIGLVPRILYMVAGFPLIPVEHIPKKEITRPAISPGPTLEYGRYLATIGGCNGCHGPTFSGGQPINGVKSANITPTGLRGWTEDDFKKVLRTGVRPNGRVLSAVMPWPYAGKMTNDEIRAIWLYLQSVPPKATGE
jgi:cytochrome c553